MIPRAFRFKLIAVIAATSVLVQSCRAYKVEQSTLEEASIANKRAKIRMNDFSTIQALRIEREDSTYYAVKKKRGEFIRVPLDPNQIKTVRLISKSGSIAVSILAGYFGLGFIATMILAVRLGHATEDDQ